LLDSSVRDPEQVHTLFQTDVLGSLPMVKTWRRSLVSTLSGDSGSTAWRAGARTAVAPPDRTVTGFEEAVRTLRNSILLGSFDRRLRSLMITSATPAEGKTTTAVHLAIAHAQQKHKTLLIDCDLRRPGVHSKLGINPETGLAAVLQNGMQWREKLVKLPDLDDLDILPTGFSSRRAADLIGRRLPEILEDAGNEYDLIVVDSPPILGFPSRCRWPPRWTAW
jgi:succinoglycan biosynthesis transport protein ExoP